MVALKLLVSLVLLQVIVDVCHGMCDQRRFGGKLKCCASKDSNCFVKVNSNRKRGNKNTICYCDDYCKFTKDCCEDADRVKSMCRKSRSILKSKYPDIRFWPVSLVERVIIPVIANLLYKYHSLDNPILCGMLLGAESRCSAPLR